MNTDNGDELTELMLQRQVAYTFVPQASQDSDGRWRAYYPCATWTVTGDSRDEALTRLRRSALEHRGTAHETNWQITAVHHHLAHGPVAGVYEIPLAVNDRIMGSSDPQAALDAVLKDIDDQRAS